MLLVIGLDGATFDVLNPWLAAGDLPTLATLLRAGAHGVLRSTLPPVTAPAWASFMTGLQPYHHGVFDFFAPGRAAQGRLELVNSSHIRGSLLWERLSVAGARVGVLNVPLTYPARAVNGFVVPGLLSPDQGATTYPAGCLARYAAELGPYRLTPRGLFRPNDPQPFIHELLAVTETQLAYALRLSREQSLDFLMVHFLATDIAQHKLWRYMDSTHPWYDSADGARYGSAIGDIFRRLDRGLGELLARLPGAPTVIVMSDHGFGPQHRTINLNNLLQATGDLRLRSTPDVWARRQAQSRPWARRILGRRRPDWRDQPVQFSDVDWARTRAYAVGHMGQIYLNVRGREPAGQVAPSDYIAERAALADRLLAWRTVDGRPIIDSVIPAPGLTQGGPDLHVIMDGYRSIAYPMFAADGQIILQQRWGDSGNHRPEGILIMAGPDIQADLTLPEAHITDLTPTILHLMGAPIPTDLDGRVLLEALTPAARARRSSPAAAPAANATTPAAQALDPSATAEIAARLRALGYLG